MENDPNEKIRRMIKEAKKILKSNPNDIWVAKGLEVMELHLKNEQKNKQSGKKR
jgi:glycerol-3-phosphate dehydrogenase